ncbi:MAG: CHAD domain-containing protein [Haloechinothrix sp.]
MTAPARRPAPLPSEFGLPEQAPVVAQSAGAGEHARARVDAQLRALLACQDGTRSGADPEDLHQFRVAIRRLRSLLKTSPMFGADGEAVRAELSRLGTITGPVRDLDVLLMRLNDDVADFDPVDRAAAATLISALRRERGHDRRTLNRALSSPRYAKLLAGIAALATAKDHDTDADSALPERDGTKLLASLRKPFRKLARAVDTLAEDPLDDDLHELRILGKRLRYAAETALPSARKSDTRQLKAVIKECKALQDLLGEHQDAVVAAERIRGLAAQSEADARVAFVAGRIVEREHARRAQVRATWPAVWHRISDSAVPLL